MGLLAGKTLAAAVAPGDTHITITPPLALGDNPAGQPIQIDDELMRVAGGAASGLLLTRAADSAHTASTALVELNPFVASETGGAGVPDPSGAPDGQVPTTADGAYALGAPSGLPPQWSATPEGQVTAEADTSDEAVLTVKAAPDSELSGDLVFQVQGETGLPIMDVDPYGNVTIQGATVDPSNGGASLVVWGPTPGGDPPVPSEMGFYLGHDGLGTPVAGFFGGSAQPQPAAIADATDPASTMARLNDLLAAMRALGLIDT